LIEGGTGDGCWSEEDVKLLKQAFEKFRFKGHLEKWKSISEMVGKSMR
jgi:hypothetical protein